MRRLAVAVALAVVAAVPAPAATLDEIVAGLNLVPLRGGASPGLALERLADGKRVKLSELRGRPVLVYFWATW